MPLIIGTNSYISLEQAKTYLFETLRGNWNSLETSTTPTPPELSAQEVHLLSAVRLMDRLLYRGIKADPNQPLSFPRDYHALTGVPQEIGWAQIETAWWLAFELSYERPNRVPVIDLKNFVTGGWDIDNPHSRIKLAVKELTLDGESVLSGSKKLTLVPYQAPILPFPIFIPEAAQLLLRDHLSTAIALER